MSSSACCFKGFMPLDAPSSNDIALYDAALSGTMQAVSYAKSLGKKIITIDPQTLTVNEIEESL